MKNKLKLFWYYAETRYVKLLRIFGVVRSAALHILSNNKETINSDLSVISGRFNTTYTYVMGCILIK